MDITIDCGNLYFGLNNVRDLEDKMFLLKQAMSKISVSNELSSAASFESAKKSFNTVLENDLDDLVVRLDNTKRILIEFDREAAYLFNYYEEGIINGDFEFTEMPLMSQTDYNDIAYSQGTIKTSGCGLTSVCMVASYLTGNLYTPSELVGATRGYGDNVSRMLAAASSVGLKWHNDSGTSHDELDQYLRDGKIAIVLVKGSSHFVVCTGITEDGKYLVNDPYGPWAMDRPISRSELKFTAGNTWIFDPAENQGVKGELDDSITVEGKAAEQIINESGFVDRTDRGEVPTDITQVEGTEAATEPRTEPKTEPRTEPRTEPKTEPRTEPKTEVRTEPRTEGATESRTESKTEPKTETATEVRTERPVENKTESTTIPKIEPVIEENTQSTVTDIPVDDYEEMTEPSMEDEAMDDTYEDINKEDNSTVDYDDFNENRSESSEEVTSVKEKNKSDTNLLIPGLAVAAGAATVGGIAYAAHSKKKNNDVEDEEKEEKVSDKFGI